MERAFRRCDEQMQASPRNNISGPDFFDARADVFRPGIVCRVGGDRNRPMIDRDQFHFEPKFARGFDQATTGPSRTTEKICAIEF